MPAALRLARTRPRTGAAGRDRRPPRAAARRSRPRGAFSTRRRLPACGHGAAAAGEGLPATANVRTVRSRQLGSAGPAVSALGLGCMGMSGMYGPADRGESIATIHAALDAGVTLLDTGDFYGMGHNELLIGEALADRPREDYLLSVKFGAPARTGRGVARLRRAPRGGEDGARLLAQPAGRGPRRYLPTRAPGPAGADRGDGRRDRRARRRGPRPLHRAFGGGGRDDPQGRERPPDLRRPDRVLTRLSRCRGRDPAGVVASSGSR